MTFSWFFGTIVVAGTEIIPCVFFLSVSRFNTKLTLLFYSLLKTKAYSKKIINNNFHKAITFFNLIFAKNTNSMFSFLYLGMFLGGAPPLESKWNFFRRTKTNMFLSLVVKGPLQILLKMYCLRYIFSNLFIDCLIHVVSICCLQLVFWVENRYVFWKCILLRIWLYSSLVLFFPCEICFS